MTNTKLTKRDALNYVIENCELPEDIKEKLEGMVEVLARRTSANRKPTAKQKENKELGLVAIEVLRGIQPATVTEVLKADPETFADISNQRMSAILNQLIKEDRCEKLIEKGRSYFKVVE